MSHNEEHGYSFVVASNQPEKVKRMRESLPDVEISHFDGSGFNSWGRMWNHAVKGTKTDIVVCCGDKASPALRDIEKGLRLVEEGFGSAQLYCMGFVVFNKYLLDVMGWVDERLSGGSGHHDFLIRHKEADIAYYESLEVSYESSPSTWRKADGLSLYSKWITPSRNQKTDFEQRLLPDEEYDYKTGAAKTDFLPYSRSAILTGNTELFRRRFLREYHKRRY